MDDPALAEPDRRGPGRSAGDDPSVAGLPQGLAGRSAQVGGAENPAHGSVRAKDHRQVLRLLLVVEYKSGKENPKCSGFSKLIAATNSKGIMEGPNDHTSQLAARGGGRGRHVAGLGPRGPATAPRSAGHRA